MVIGELFTIAFASFRREFSSAFIDVELVWTLKCFYVYFQMFAIQ